MMNIIQYSEFNMVSDKIRMSVYGVKMKTQKNRESGFLRCDFGLGFRIFDRSNYL
jgi:hypothetical protein